MANLFITFKTHLAKCEWCMINMTLLFIVLCKR